jgi:HTH-type transcriptional repressor of NAD biosynthesis genes
VLVCATPKEPIAGDTRRQWLQATYRHQPRVQTKLLEYDDEYLPNTSASSREASRLWAAQIGQAFPGIDIFFSSEPYGDYVAEYLNIEHQCFDTAREQVPISASAILQHPFREWAFIAPAARSFFVKKICISGSESTGKSTLTERLARHFNTVYVPEMARDIIEKTEDVSYHHLLEIAELHAKTINEKLGQANKILVCDTDANITCSYARFLFNRELQLPAWVLQANRFDLHLFLETDCPFVQDGTRLSEAERNRLSHFHQQQLSDAGINWHAIRGSWEERFEQARALIETNFSGLTV